MKIYDLRVNKDNDIKDNYAVAIGNFDGVHQAHSKIISLASELALKNNLKLGVMSFDITPRQVVNNIDNYYVLRSNEQKKAILESFKVDTLFLIHFNHQLKNLSAQDFINDMIIKNNIKLIVCGFDYRFGKDKQGDVSLLQEYSEFETHVIDKVAFDNEKIASTTIHEMIAHGDIETANSLLTQPYSIIGKVISGNKRGRTIGFPTANLLPSVNYRIPQSGVYATKSIVNGKEYYSMTNIGHNPTFNFCSKTSIETNIFDFNEDIYDQQIEVIFIKCLRREKIFSNVDELVEQITTDKQKISAYFKQL